MRRFNFALGIFAALHLAAFFAICYYNIFAPGCQWYYGDKSASCNEYVSRIQASIGGLGVLWAAIWACSVAWEEL